MSFGDGRIRDPKTVLFILGQGLYDITGTLRVKELQLSDGEFLSSLHLTFHVLTASGSDLGRINLLQYFSYKLKET